MQVHPVEETGKRGSVGGPAWLRNVRRAIGRRTRSLGLTQQFLIVAIAVITAATVLLGSIISEAVRDGVTEGVAETAAAGFDSLVANSVGQAFAEEALSEEDRARLATLFEIGSDAQTTRLIQLRIFRPNGQLLYEATDGIVDVEQQHRLAGASDTLMTCLHEVVAGRRWLPTELVDRAISHETSKRDRWRQLSQRLTPREAQIAAMIAAGSTNKQIAFALDISDGTTKVHLNNLFRKLGITSRRELSALMSDLGDSAA